MLVQGVARDVNALGYFGYAYYVENKDKLKAVPIVNDKGQAVEPSMEAVLNGSLHPAGAADLHLRERQVVGKPEVKEFVEFYLKNGAELAKEVKYVPLPDDGVPRPRWSACRRARRAPCSAAPPRSASRSKSC